MNTLTNTSNKNRKHHLFQNPVMNKFSKITEKSDQHVTYNGVAKKCGFFVLMIIAGIVLTFLTNFFSGISHTFSDKYPLPVIILASIATLCFIITPFITIFAKKGIPVFGSIFCVSVGVIYSSAALFIDEYRNYILLAMILTIALFSALTLLFTFNIIKVNQKFRSTAYTILATLVITGLILAISFFVPVLNGAVTAIITNPLWCIGISLIGVALASMFILIDLQNVREAVENQVPKSYEWDGAFGIVFSVIWLFAEILQLLTSTKDAF